MNLEYYQAFIEYKELGFRKNASKALGSFIQSFESMEEIEAWVWAYLSELDGDRYPIIRHEIFQKLVYPVLKAGYEKDDFLCTLWLGRLAQNIYKNSKIHEELDWITDYALYQKSYEISPDNEEARLSYLEVIIRWLRYTEHEWPRGILCGANGATPEECDEIASEVQRALELDRESIYSDFIEQYCKNLNEYRSRIEDT